ncbi:helix-turn-helix domain-containing protein [Streptomyces sp. RLB1-33]
MLRRKECCAHRPPARSPWRSFTGEDAARVQREDRAAEQLAAATELFLTRGYAGTTMADISAAAGVARSNVYGYY